MRLHADDGDEEEKIKARESEFAAEYAADRGKAEGLRRARARVASRSDLRRHRMMRVVKACKGCG